MPRGGRSLFDVDLTGALAVLIGGEGAGLATQRSSTAADERDHDPDGSRRSSR